MNFAEVYYSFFPVKLCHYFCFLDLRVSPMKQLTLADNWKKLVHVNVVQLRDVIQTRQFGDYCKFFFIGCLFMLSYVVFLTTPQFLLSSPRGYIWAYPHPLKIGTCCVTPWNKKKKHISSEEIQDSLVMPSLEPCCLLRMYNSFLRDPKLLFFEKLPYATPKTIPSHTWNLMSLREICPRTLLICCKDFRKHVKICCGYPQTRCG